MTKNDHGNDLKVWFDEVGKRPESVAEFVALRLVTDADLLRQDLGLSLSDLARRMGVSRQHVHKLMGGTQNSTIGSLVKLALALGCELKISLEPKPQETNTGGAEDIASAPARPAKKKPAETVEAPKQKGGRKRPIKAG